MALSFRNLGGRGHTMPANIQLFVWLCFASTVASVAGYPFAPPKTRTESVYWSSAVLVLIWAFFVYVAAWRRENWGRWAIAAMVALCIPGFLLMLKKYSSQYPIFVGVQTVSLIWNFAALYYVFTGDAQHWFK